MNGKKSDATNGTSSNGAGARPSLAIPQSVVDEALKVKLLRPAAGTETGNVALVLRWGIWEGDESHDQKMSNVH